MVHSLPREYRLLIQLSTAMLQSLDSNLCIRGINLYTTGVINVVSLHDCTFYLYSNRSEVARNLSMFQCWVTPHSPPSKCIWHHTIIIPVSSLDAQEASYASLRKASSLSRFQHFLTFLLSALSCQFARAYSILDTQFKLNL